MVRKGKAGLVLGASLIGLFSLVWVAQSFSPLFGDDHRFDSVEIAGKRLSLSARNGACVLRVAPDAPNIELNVGVPCYFQRKDGDLFVESFPNFSIDRIFAVIGTLIDEETRETFGIELDTVCAVKAQALVIENDEIFRVDHVAGGGIWCRDKGVDRKRLWEFAEYFRSDQPPGVTKY